MESNRDVRVTLRYLDRIDSKGSFVFMARSLPGTISHTINDPTLLTIYET